jgi:hypothetical protein
VIRSNEHSGAVVAIHQPNFFPWLGYFGKIAAADVFVFLDQVDYPKSGKSMGSYVNRVKLAIQGKAQWWGCPVQREPGVQPIDAVQIKTEPWVEKRLRTLQQHYARAPYFAEYWDVVRELVQRPEQSLARYNRANIEAVAGLLGLKTKFVAQSELNASGTSTERLVNIVRAVGGGVYLSGAGGSNYQEQSMFEAAGIELRYLKFCPQPYEQLHCTEFLPGLSVLDSLFHCGAEGAVALCKEGCQGTCP